MQRSAQEVTHLPQLDTLRFFAALTVMMAHYAEAILLKHGVDTPLVQGIRGLSAIGMPVFFILSGVVIHHAYYARLTQRGGLKIFWVARFSRLYPLYFILFLGELALGFIFHVGACVERGNPMGVLLGLPFHLTFTQSWFYGVICEHSLIYQYLLVSAVAWSVSVEFFLYLVYAFYLRRLLPRIPLRRLTMLCSAAFIVLAIYLGAIYHWQNVIEQVATSAFGPLATTASGYQDSLLRWLYYFNPLIWLVPFLWGIAIAEWHRLHPIIHKKGTNGLRFLAIVGMLALLYYIVVLRLSPLNSGIGRTQAFLLMPLIALLIVSLLRRPIRIAAWRPFVSLGEASYSIYLLHIFLSPTISWLARTGLGPWMMYLVAMGVILAISRLSYIMYERPAQRWVKSTLLRKTS